MAHIFPTDIQQTLPLASGDGRDYRAPAVTEGDAFANHLELATREEANRISLHEAFPNVVSLIEIKQSRLRRVAIETAEAQITHGIGNAAILAAVQANSTAIQDILAAVQANSAAIQDILAAVQANSTAIQDILATVQGNSAAIQANQAATQANTDTIQDILATVQANAEANQNNEDKIQATQAMILNLRRRDKCRSGTWTPLLVERVGPNPVGVPPANFPTSHDDIFSMGKAAITALQNAFNLPPNAFAGDSLAERRAAVLDYILEGF